MKNLKLNLEEGSTCFRRSALHYQSAITMKLREVVEDRHAGGLLKVNEASLAFPYVKSDANFNERQCSETVWQFRPRRWSISIKALPDERATTDKA